MRNTKATFFNKQHTFELILCRYIIRYEQKKKKINIYRRSTDLLHKKKFLKKVPHCAGSSTLL